MHGYSAGWSYLPPPTLEELRALLAELEKSRPADDIYLIAVPKGHRVFSIPGREEMLNMALKEIVYKPLFGERDAEVSQ